MLTCQKWWKLLGTVVYANFSDYDCKLLYDVAWKTYLVK